MAPQKCYICSFCARSFSRSEHKLRHERSHTKEKPFNCNICHNAFVRRDLLQRHCRTVHGLVLKANIEAAVSSTLDKDNNISTITNKKKINNTINASNSTKEISPVIIPQTKKSPLVNSQQTVSKPTGSESLQADDSTTTENNDDGKFNTDNNNNNNQSSNTTTTTNTQGKQNILTERTIITLLTICKKFNHLSIGLNNSISNYLLLYGTSIQSSIPFINFNKLLNLTENDELLYLIICLGACECKDIRDSVVMFNKAWEIMITKISSSQITYNSQDKFDEFLEHLIILCFTYLNYFVNFANEFSFENYDNGINDYDNFNDVFEINGDWLKKIAIPIDVLFEYLNNIISTQINNNSKDKNGKKPEVKLFYWYAYILLSQYSFIYNKSASSLHNYLLDQILPDIDIDLSKSPSSSSSSSSSSTTGIKKNEEQPKYTLGYFMKNLSVTANIFKSLHSSPPPHSLNSDTLGNGNESQQINFEEFLRAQQAHSFKYSLGFKEKLIICGLMNELQIIKFNDSNKQLMVSQAVNNASGDSGSVNNINTTSVGTTAGLGLGNASSGGNSTTISNSRINQVAIQNGLFKDNKKFLHNAIILANRTFNYGYNFYESAVINNSNSAINGSNHRYFNTLSNNSNGSNNGSNKLKQNNTLNTDSTIGLLNDGFSDGSEKIPDPASASNQTSISTSNTTTSPSVDNMDLNSQNQSFLYNNNSLINNRFVNIHNQIQFLNILILTKRRLLINCPLKFTDLLSNYLFLPKDHFNWTLLSLTLKEFIHETESYSFLDSYNNNSRKRKLNSNSTAAAAAVAAIQNHYDPKLPMIEFDLSRFVVLQTLDGQHERENLNEDRIRENIKSYITCPLVDKFSINNNLGITTLPLLMLGLVFVNNSLKKHKKFINLPQNSELSIEFIIGNFLVLIRILLHYRKKYYIESKHFVDDSNNNNNNDDLKIKNDQDSTTTTTTDDEEESTILSVILYVITELGGNNCNELIDKRSQVDSFKKYRSNSISIGEFENNNEKLRQLQQKDLSSLKMSMNNQTMNGTNDLNSEGIGGKSSTSSSSTTTRSTGSTGSNSKKFESIKDQIMNDLKFYFFMKNLETCFISWLFVVNINQRKRIKFIRAMKMTLYEVVYDQILNNETRQQQHLQQTQFNGGRNSLYSTTTNKSVTPPSSASYSNNFNSTGGFTLNTYHDNSNNINNNNNININNPNNYKIPNLHQNSQSQDLQQSQQFNPLSPQPPQQQQFQYQYNQQQQQQQQQQAPTLFPSFTDNQKPVKAQQQQQSQYANSSGLDFPLKVNSLFMHQNDTGSNSNNSSNNNTNNTGNINNLFDGLQPVNNETPSFEIKSLNQPTAGGFDSLIKYKTDSGNAVNTNNVINNNSTNNSNNTRNDSVNDDSFHYRTSGAMKNGLLKLQQYHQKTFENNKRMKFDNNNKSNYLDNSNSNANINTNNNSNSNSNTNNVYNSSSSSSTTSFQNTGNENSKILLPPIQNQNPNTSSNNRESISATTSQNSASYQLAGSIGMSYPTAANNTTGFNPSISDNYSNNHHDRIGSSDAIIDNASSSHGNSATDTLPSFTS